MEEMRVLLHKPMDLLTNSIFNKSSSSKYININNENDNDNDNNHNNDNDNNHFNDNDNNVKIGYLILVLLYAVFDANSCSVLTAD